MPLSGTQIGKEQLVIWDVKLFWLALVSFDQITVDKILTPILTFLYEIGRSYTKFVSKILSFL